MIFTVIGTQLDLKRHCGMAGASTALAKIPISSEDNHAIQPRSSGFTSATGCFIVGWSFSIRQKQEVEAVKVHKIDHVGIVVNDLAAAKAFFLDVGLELQGEGGDK